MYGFFGRQLPLLGVTGGAPGDDSLSLGADISAHISAALGGHISTYISSWADISAHISADFLIHADMR